VIERRKVLQGVGGNLPLGFWEVEPHEDTAGHRKGAVHKAGLEAKMEEHRWSGIATQISLKALSLSLEGIAGTYHVAIPMIELVKKVIGPVLTV